MNHSTGGMFCSTRHQTNLLVNKRLHFNWLISEGGGWEDEGVRVGGRGKQTRDTKMTTLLLIIKRGREREMGSDEGGFRKRGGRERRRA